MRKYPFIVLIAICCATTAFTQGGTDAIKAISIENDHDFEGFDLITIEDEQLFALAEHWHNIRAVPKATLKLLKYLHATANVRILAIEQGASVAYMINEYLETGDTLMLAHITRNTMFWGRENRAFFEELRDYNQTLEADQRITVESIDIEYKMESAVFYINQMIGDRKVPLNLSATVGEFKRIYEQTKPHREQFDGIAVMFYYERAYIQNLLIQTINHMNEQSQQYIDFFGDDFSTFATMILEMDDGLTFDYTNPNNNYKFRDNIIYEKFEALAAANPEKGILTVIGERHAHKGSSIQDLEKNNTSPLKDKVMIIRVSALYNKMINSGDLRKINFNYPKRLKENNASLIRHLPDDPILKSKKGFDYTLFINENGSLTPFENILTEDY